MVLLRWSVVGLARCFWNCWLTPASLDRKGNFKREVWFSAKSILFLCHQMRGLWARLGDGGLEGTDACIDLVKVCGKMFPGEMCGAGGRKS